MAFVTNVPGVAAVDVRNLTRFFGAFAAVQDVSFEIPPGQIAGLVGPAGSGKSTILRMLTAFTAPTGGSARVCGFDVQEQRVSVLSCIGYLPDNPPFYADMTLAGMLQFFGEARQIDRALLKNRIAEIVALCGMDEVLQRPMSRLSPPLRLRASLAQALVHDPSVLIFDEPGSRFDAGPRRAFLDQLRTLRGTRTVLVSSGTLADVEPFVERVLAIKAGRLVFDGTPQEMKSRRPLGGLRAV